ncbi:hypothetical protein [Methanococcus sp. CF]
MNWEQFLAFQKHCNYSYELKDDGKTPAEHVDTTWCSITEKACDPENCPLNSRWDRSREM